MVKGLTQYCQIWQQNIHNTNLEYPILYYNYCSLCLLAQCISEPYDIYGDYCCNALFYNLRIFKIQQKYYLQLQLMYIFQTEL